MSERTTGKLDIDLRVRVGEFQLSVVESLSLSGVTGVFGPSGSGKSTLLRAIAGFEPSATGRIRFDGTDWQNDVSNAFLAPHVRPVGYVFQDARLFPHLDVRGNLEFALRRASAGTLRFEDVVEAMDIAPFLDRRIGRLSGGEQQRVAIARSLLTHPRLMLFDEPLASLDTRSRLEILPFLEQVTRSFDIPALYVSHSAAEMARLSDHVLVLEKGEIIASDTAVAVLSRAALDAPSLPFEAIAVLDVAVDAQLPELMLTRVRHGEQLLTVPAIAGASPGDTARLAIRSGDVVLATSEPRDLSVRNVLQGVVDYVDEIEQSAFATVTVRVNGSTLLAQLTKHAVRDLGIEPGLPVFALIKTAAFERG